MQKPPGPLLSDPKPVALIGYSGHALVVLDALLSRNREAAAYCEPDEVAENPHQLLYLGPETSKEVLKKLRSYQYFVAIGNNKSREQISRKLQQELGSATRVVHKTAVVSGLAKIGAGVFLGPFAVVNARAEIGEGAICNSASVVEHGCVVGSYAHIGPGAVLAGNVKIGRNSLVGANAVVRPGINIGENVIIGAGSVVVADISDNFKVAGNPARPLPQRQGTQHEKTAPEKP